jgi:hypothetical protein
MSNVAWKKNIFWANWAGIIRGTLATSFPKQGEDHPKKVQMSAFIYVCKVLAFYFFPNLSLKSS